MFLAPAKWEPNKILFGEIATGVMPKIIYTHWIKYEQLPWMRRRVTGIGEWNGENNMGFTMLLIWVNYIF